MLGLLDRPTQDVDVVAMARQGEGKLWLEEAAIPEDVRRLAAEVAEDLGLGSAWLNTEPKELLRKGLPRGAETRLAKRDFGSRLRVYVLAREDLICLKSMRLRIAQAASNNTPATLSR